MYMRALPLHMNIVEVGYNNQIAVEAENKLIVDYEVTDRSRLLTRKS